LDFTDDGIYDWSSTSTCSTITTYGVGTFYPKLRVIDDDGQSISSTTVIMN